MKLNPVIELTIPDDKRVFYVGDIHANYKLYERALKQFGITADDYVISVGDIIDRGDDNIKIVDEFFNKPNRYMVQGNHEFMFIESEYDSEWRDVWLNNGGSEFVRDVGYGGATSLRPYFRNLPVLIVVNHRGKRIGVAHSGIPRKYTDFNKVLDDIDDEQLQYDLMWDTSAFNYAKNKSNTKVQPNVDNVDYVIHGHVAVPKNYTYGNRVYIDTQFLGGELCFAYLDDQSQLQFLQRKRDAFSFVIPTKDKK